MTSELESSSRLVRLLPSSHSHHCRSFHRAAGTVIDSSVILNPVAASPQLISPSVHSCVWHCPQLVTVVAAVVFVPLSLVDFVSSGSGIVLFDPVMLSFTNPLCNCPWAVLTDPLAFWRCYPHATLAVLPARAMTMPFLASVFFCTSGPRASVVPRTGAVVTWCFTLLGTPTILSMYCV